MRFSLILFIVIAFSSVAEDKAAPNFSGALIQGKGEVSLSDYQGQPVLLDFWASWCSSCLKSLPLFQTWHERSLDGVRIVSINVDEYKSDGIKMVEKLALTFPVIYDPTLSIAAKYNVKALPVTFLIDAKGVVRLRHDGFNAGDGKKLAKLLPFLKDTSIKKHQ